MLLYVALPPERFTVAKTVAPSRKVTVPTAVVVAELTVAVNFTFFPALAGFGVVASAVVVVAGRTTYAVFPELPADWASPL